jgi:hypothetical protein
MHLYSILIIDCFTSGTTRNKVGNNREGKEIIKEEEILNEETLLH